MAKRILSPLPCVVSLALLSVIGWDLGAATTRNLRIESTPNQATVFVNGVDSGRTPLDLPKVVFRGDTVLKIKVAKDRYEPGERQINYPQAKDLPSSRPWVISFVLEEIRRERDAIITANVDKASISINRQPAGFAPMTNRLVFHRTNGTSWSSVVVRADKEPNYKSEEKTVTAADPGEAPLQLRFQLDEVRREVPVAMSANIEGAVLSVDGKRIGLLPATNTFVFQRTDGKSAWPAFQIQIQKEGFEYRPPEPERPMPVFSRTLSLTEAMQGKLAANQFGQLRFVSTPVRAYQVFHNRVVIQQTNFLSEVQPIGPHRPTPIAKLDHPFVLSRISAVPGQPDKIAYAIPLREQRPGPGNNSASGEVIGANLIMSQGAAITPMTQGRYYDLDPCVALIDEVPWIYFSSDRSQKRIIWRMRASGQGGYTPITGNFTFYDTEPAVSPDGKRLAYTSRLPDALPNSPSYIWIAESDGKLPTQMWAGQSPSWSPDSKQIVFVGPDYKIWIANADGSGSTTQLTKGETVECCPVWMPSGKHIIYARDTHDRGERNFDLWKMGIDGGNDTKLTLDGSFDSAPAVSSDEKFVYFFSNRGGQKDGHETLQIYRIDLSQ